MLLTAEIERILTNLGTVKVTSSFIGEPETSLARLGHVDYQYHKTNLSVNDGVITIDRVANNADDHSYNCVNVITNSNKSCLGTVWMPGYVYTDQFSGCVFYLYRNGNFVTGVHAHQGMDTVHTTVRHGPFKLFSKQINSQVRKEYGPREYMAMHARRELCRHETRGELTDQEKMTYHSLAFLSCVELDKATTFLYCYKNNHQTMEKKLVRFVDKFVDKF